MYEELLELAEAIKLERTAESQTWSRAWEELASADARAARAKADRNDATVVRQRDPGRNWLAFLQLKAGLWPRS